MEPTGSGRRTNHRSRLRGYRRCDCHANRHAFARQQESLRPGDGRSHGRAAHYHRAGGPWSDTKSPQSCLYTGVAALFTGLLVCTIAPNAYVLILGRAIQGLGGGLVVVPLYTMVGYNVRPSRQPGFFAAFAAAWVVPAIVGPAVAGFIVQHASWRIVFGVVPAVLLLAAPSLVMSTRTIPYETTPTTRSELRRSAMPALIAGIAVGVLQAVSGTPSDSFSAWLITVIALATVIAFVSIQPLLPLGTFISRRGLASTVLLRGLINGSFIGIEAFLPLLLQDVHGWNPAQAGLILTVGSVTWAIGSAIQGRITSFSGRRRLAVTGAFIQLFGILVVLPGSFPEVTGLVVLAGWTISGLGIGLSYPAMTVHGLSLTAPENQGRTSSALQLADTLGSAFCVAIGGIAFALVMPQESAAFATVFGGIALVMLMAVMVARRVQPHPGSREEAQQRASLAADHEQ
ncbi:MFS transporter [Actinobaculum sp. 313]|uniref:MFS transporter n=1 Tax=Actinobaculum sp. 313 TaxID=2495645 RepID=UPI000D5299E3|nr:MFS transporter [Actinobaculum sp. 313]AWE42333.1 MFS transporter [Actinobaculum sp. 313]